MKSVNPDIDRAHEAEEIASMCCGIPRGDELPQVAGVEDILLDVYSDVLNMPRELASGHFHHQFEDDMDMDALIH